MEQALVFGFGGAVDQERAALKLQRIDQRDFCPVGGHSPHAFGPGGGQTTLAGTRRSRQRQNPLVAARIGGRPGGESSGGHLVAVRQDQGPYDRRFQQKRQLQL
ncbi:MAG: hypothetical protein ACK45V_00195 [Brevundimonas sp.]